VVFTVTGMNATNADAASAIRRRRGQSSSPICRTSSIVPSSSSTFSACAARCGSPRPACSASQSTIPATK
jgi:hypothetical protein